MNESEILSGITKPKVYLHTKFRPILRRSCENFLLWNDLYIKSFGGQTPPAYGPVRFT